MLNATPSSVIHRMSILWVLFSLILLPAALWSQQEGQAALEPMFLSSQSGMSKAISQGRKLTIKGFPDRPFSVRGRLLGVSRDSVHLAMDARGFDQAKVKIEDVGSVSILRIGWLIFGVVLLLYLGGAAVAIVAAIAAAGGVGGAMAIGVLFALLFGPLIFVSLRAGFRTYRMTRWKIQRGR